MTLAQAVADLRSELTEFLYREAELLDERRYNEWLELLADDYRYVVPQMLINDDDRAPRYDERAYLVMESKSSMRLKLSRGESEFAWAMRPPAVERRLVSNVIIEPQGSDRFEVRSVVLVSWSRGPVPISLYPASRRDVISRADSGPRIHRRHVRLASEVADSVQLAVLY
jgi:3-phenylpropionate/cinnamic acid dioxygenase small subunit